METPLTYERLSFDVILSSGWGVFVFSALLSTVGLILSRVLRNSFLSWLISTASIFAVFFYSIFGKTTQDPFQVVFFDKLFFTSALFISLLSITSFFVGFAELSSKLHLFPEYFFFMSVSTLGGIILTSSRDFLTLLLAKELLSMPIYAMVYAFRDRIGVEAAFKYFISGAVFSLFFILGMALFFISEGTLKIVEPRFILGIFGLHFMLFSLLFKAGAAPFHFWVPDVYQGAPASAVVFAGSTVKFAAFVALLRISDMTKMVFTTLFDAVVVLSVVIGVLGALAQREIKRMIAYSSVAHSGFISLFLLAPGNETFRNYFIFYLATYGIAIAGAFSIISLFRERFLYFDELSGFSRTHRFFASLLSVFLLSFAGLPLFAGFFGKYFAFISALSVGEVIPVIVSVLGSIVSLYFYFAPLVRMFMLSEGEGGVATKLQSDGGGPAYDFLLNPFVGFIIFSLALITIVFGVFPDIFFNLLSKIPLFS